MPETVVQLEELLSDPPSTVIKALQDVHGDIVILGVAGKMGPTLARMARLASESAGAPRRIIGVSRFTDPRQEDALRWQGIDVIRCDLLDEAAVAKLPDAENVIFMAGMKFGATGNEARTWAMNCYLPSIICHRYRSSRIVAFSTGNVYGLTPVEDGGATEHAKADPAGEYAMSCLGRERMFEYFSAKHEIPMAILRLNYACELRYGVLVDLAQQVWNTQPIDLSMGYFNTIWQRDANAMALQCLRETAIPPKIINITGPEVLSFRQTAEQFGQLLGRPVILVGHEQRTALLSNASFAHSLFGPPQMPVSEMMELIANWIRNGRPTLGKPTHFESRDGSF